MEDTGYRAIAIVGAGAVLPDARNVPAFWENVKSGRYSITEVSPDRWNPALYYDPDPSAPDKTYSKIGGWVREFDWNPLSWKLPLPPRVVEGMDGAQKWAIACTREAMQDFGYPSRPLNLERTAVILGNAMAGERHYQTSFRVYFPEYARELSESASFAALPDAIRRDITRDLHRRMSRLLPEITEDSMPGELSNCLAGRVANLFNCHGPNFVTDAACASAMAAITAAAQGLIDNQFDTAITGGIDRNMGASTFVKFCKIGALSGTGSRPFAAGADGFVMGEGAAIFLMKRLADAERDGDKIYAVLRGIGGSSDGKGKGLTAPNPIGQKLAVQRAWQNAGLPPSTATLIEAHGTSTRVGDVVEVESFNSVLDEFHVPAASIALGSVKSNIGHLKGGAGAAGLLKTALALRDKVLPPSVQCDRRNPDIDFARSPLYVNTELRPWTVTGGGIRRAGLSAFGFGGTNFHAVLEEYIPHRLTGNGKRSVVVSEAPPRDGADPGGPLSNGPVEPLEPQDRPHARPASLKSPLRGALLIGGNSDTELGGCLRSVLQTAQAGRAPAPAPPAERDLRAPARIAIDYGDPSDLADKAAKALKALQTNQQGAWKALRPQGIFHGTGPAPKVAFLFTGQGSQYVNMLLTLREAEPIVARVFTEADRVMTPLLGKPLSEFIFVAQDDVDAIARCEDDLRQTAITQPAVLATDLALTNLLAAYGIVPDMTMGHSLGEYGALVASGGLPFEDALQAVSARGREMTRVSMADNGRMAAVFAPIDQIERILQSVAGYAVIANINSSQQAVIGGASAAVEQAIVLFQNAGYNAVPLPVSHAFHTSIVQPASEPLCRTLERMHLAPPRIPIVANVDGEFYPTGPGAVPKMLNILGRQISAPVQFVKGLRTLYQAGARVLVEVGPKKALHGFAEDVLGGNADVLPLFTNHPKVGDIVAFNQALCGLYAAGLGAGAVEPLAQPAAASSEGPAARHNLPVGITGAALGLPGQERIFDDANASRILRGEQCIDVIPTRLRRAMLDKNITRLVKSDNGNATFEHITSPSEVIKLAGRGGAFDLEHEFGVPADRIPALDRGTQLAIAAGIDALRDAGIPLVMRYKTTTRNTRLPDRWELPEAMRDDTGVIFASAFPGCDSFAGEMSRYYADRGRRETLAALEDLRTRAAGSNGDRPLVQELDRRIEELRTALEKDPYTFDRRFIFRILPMGHSQFAEYIGARGPNTQVNAACASTTQAISLAQDWIRAARCRRVIIISADDITSDHLIEWLGSAFLASGAAATDAVVEDAALPFDRRRHGLIMGMGAAALVVESADSARERGIQPICEVLSAVTANSAFHGTRLDQEHICQVMESLVAEAEMRAGVPRDQFASRMVFISHETYTPARGGSASAEIHSLRRVFGDAADRIVISNTKGFTGHAMAAGIEDVIAVKALETGCVPPVANFKEIDPELGPLNLSKGGAYPIEFALRLGAGFGSQISMTLLRWVKTRDGLRSTSHSPGYANRILDPVAWNAWLSRMAGHAAPDLEVVNRTLRVRDRNAAAIQPAPVSPAAVEVPQHRELEPPTLAAPKPVADPIAERVLAIVAEKTGYPRDMLALDLDLEADLGIDTVKQAEMFAAIREAYGIERDPNLKLRDFPTLAHVIRFAQDRSGASTAVAPPPPAPPASDPIKEKVLDIVAEKTGYPKDMLDPELDLEADLGIDTVKQAEMFAAIREAYGIDRDPNLKLRDFPTLAHVIRFAQDRSGASTAVAPPPPAPPASDPIKEKVLDIVAEKTGYPKDMLDPELDLEADLGIDMVKQAEMFAAIREAYGIERDPNLKLRDFPTLAHVIRFAQDRSGASTAVAPPPPAPPASDPIKEKVLDIVAEKTGYPKDMLDPELDLEADLGIDTVKQAEMFAAIREAYGIERDPNLKLRDFPTLAHVIRFAQDRSGARIVVAPPPPSAPLATDPIKEKVLDIVAEKTGYPKDMLDPELDLEADLGIDTVKQAEMFAAIREAYGIERDPNLKLRDFPTLAHVIRFAQQRAGTAQAAPSPVAAARPKPAALDATASVPRRVPVPTPRPPLTHCKPTGVTLHAGTRVTIMSDTCGCGAALSSRLQEMGVTVIPLVDAMAGAPVQGVYWLPALDPEGDLTKLGPAAWHEAVQLRVKSLYAAMRKLYGAFLISATRLGGLHGYDDAGAVAPLGGAVSGFCKAYKRERPEALVKVVDFSLSSQAADIAELLIEETLHDPGAVEIGYHRDQRFTICLEERPFPDAEPALALNRDSVFVITGAAGSIVSAITADLAAASGGTFYLLDVVPEPATDNPDLTRFVADRDGLKRDLFARIHARGERATPALVEKELAALERAHAAHRAIESVHAAGGTAHYLNVNLTDADSVAHAIDEVRRRSGRIDVLLHAAGIDRSRSLADKEPGEFNLVFDVKADGWFYLLHAIGDMPLKATVAFCSIAGRFGNMGQVDYSAANDLLSKIASSFRSTRPATRALAIDWTAWGGIGMATRGSIPKVMELAGIDMLPPEAGIPWVRRELTSGGRGEVVVAQRLGVLLGEFDPDGGLDRAAPHQHAAGPLIGNIATMGIHNGLTIETALDPAGQPFLHDHQIEGTPVLPGVIGIEAFAETALWPLSGWRIEAVENVNFLAPFKFYRSEPREVTTHAAFRLDGDRLLADCRLTGSRMLANQAEPQLTTHFTGRVRLAREPLAPAVPPLPCIAEGSPIEATQIYEIYFHGPAYQVLERAWWDGRRMVGQFASGLPVHHHPSDRPLVIAPRLIELCFQTAGLFEMVAHQRMGLPLHVDRVQLHRTPEASTGPLFAVVVPAAASGSFDIDVVDATGNLYLRVSGYRAVQFRELGDLHTLFAVTA